MIDPEIISFYNSVKDQSWPNIENYFDFLKLDDRIKDECYNQFMFDQRLEEICDSNYWVNITTKVFVYKNLSFVPVLKCASTYYETLFHELGWQEVLLKDVNRSSTHFFGFLMHPIKRHLKGVTQLLVQSHDPLIPVPTENHYKVQADKIDFQQIKLNLSRPEFKNFISKIYVGDEHSIPYTTAFGDFFYNVHWMPLDSLTKNEQLTTITNFCKIHGHNIDIKLPGYNLNESTLDKLEVYNLIETMFNENEFVKYPIYKLFGKDLKFFYNLLKSFSIDWNHIAS